MSENNQVTGRIQNEKGVVILDITLFGSLIDSKLLREEMIKEYDYLRESKHEEIKTKSCIISLLKVDVAGSPLVRTLYELYKKVNAEGGTLYCIGYPEDYLDSLIALGLPFLKGFKLSQSLDEALNDLS